MASNLKVLSTKSLVPWSVKTQGISRPRCGKSLEYFLFGSVLGSVTSQSIVPPFLINSEQVELVFFGKCPTIVPALVPALVPAFITFIWVVSIADFAGTLEHFA